MTSLFVCYDSARTSAGLLVNGVLVKTLSDQTLVESCEVSCTKPPKIPDSRMLGSCFPLSTRLSLQLRGHWLLWKGASISVGFIPRAIAQASDSLGSWLWNIHFIISRFTDSSTDSQIPVAQPRRGCQSLSCSTPESRGPPTTLSCFS